jgi:hypothetical protein
VLHHPVHGQEVADGGNVRVDVAHATHAVLDLGNDLRLAVRLLNAKVGSQLVDDG